MNAEHAIQAAMMADWWAVRRFPHLQPGEMLGLAWEAASRVRPEHARRRAVLAVMTALSDSGRLRSTGDSGPRHPREEVAGSAASFERLRYGPMAEAHEPDRFGRLRLLLASSGLTHLQASALHGWAHGRPVADEAHRLGVSRNRVNQLRHRAMERLGGVL